jgi:hypothetical protein
MSLKSIWIIALPLFLLASGCKKENVTTTPPDTGGNGGGGGGTPPKPGTPTEVGNPVGNPTVATIGPNGGTLAMRMPKVTGQQRSSLFELRFPAGCFESNVQVSVQPIENKTPNARGLAFRLSVDQPGVVMKKPAELTITETPINANEPEVHISVQDPVIRIWRAARGRTIAPGKRKYKVSKAADWAFFQNYQLQVYDYSKHAVTEDSVNGDHINLVTHQALVMEVKRIYIRDTDIPLDDDSTMFLPMPVAETVGNDAIHPVKWRFNGVVVSESTNTLPAQSPQGWFVFEGTRFETLRYTAPLVLQGDGTTPFEGRLEAEVRGTNNGPMMLMIQRIKVTNPNEYKLNGQSVKNAMAEVLGNSGILSLMLKKNTDPNHRENIGFTSLLGAQPSAYALNQNNKDINAMAATTHQPFHTYNHSYVDRQGNEHFSNGHLTISQIKVFSRYKIFIGTFSSTLYDYDRQTETLKTITASGKFEAVEHN